MMMGTLQSTTPMYLGLYPHRERTKKNAKSTINLTHPFNIELHSQFLSTCVCALSLLCNCYCFQQFERILPCHFLTVKSNKIIGAGEHLFTIVDVNDNMIHLNASFELAKLPRNSTHSDNHSQFLSFYFFLQECSRMFLFLQCS